MCSVSFSKIEKLYVLCENWAWYLYFSRFHVPSGQLLGQFMVWDVRETIWMSSASVCVFSYSGLVSTFGPLHFLSGASTVIWQDWWTFWRRSVCCSASWSVLSLYRLLELFKQCFVGVFDTFLFSVTCCWHNIALAYMTRKTIIFLCL